MPKERRLFMIMWNAFKESLKQRDQFGKYKGEDFLGNRYFELNARPEIGRRKPSRWFESKNNDLMQEVPPEWESWLRNRRDDPPTEEEILRNRALFELKKKNSTKMAENEPTKPYDSGRVRFPRFRDLEMYPGQHQKRED